jgi:hypothetical protein
MATATMVTVFTIKAAGCRMWSSLEDIYSQVGMPLPAQSLTNTPSIAAS